MAALNCEIQQMSSKPRKYLNLILIQASQPIVIKGMDSNHWGNHHKGDCFSFVKYLLLHLSFCNILNYMKYFFKIQKIFNCSGEHYLVLNNLVKRKGMPLINIQSTGRYNNFTKAIRQFLFFNKVSLLLNASLVLHAI